MQLLSLREQARPLLLIAALTASTFVLSACGGGDDSSPFAALPASGPAAQAPGGTAGTPGGAIPPHDGSGRLHYAFAITADALQPWRDHLSRRGVAIESEVNWPRGGRSLYFRDPDGNLLSLSQP